jgi:hypothetical protein
MEVTSLLVSTLLHEDAAVRTAAASLAFNVAAHLQKRRIDRVKGGVSGADSAEDGDWEVEIISAVIEVIDREKGSEEIGQFIMFVFLLFRSIDRLVCYSSSAYGVLGIPTALLTLL